MSGGIVVIGGGVSGLTVAHRLSELARREHRPAAITVLESGARLGGQVRTERDGSFLFEAGADTLLTQKPWGVALCNELGLADELEDVGARLRGTEILHRGRLVRVPDGFLMMAPTRYAPVLASSLFSLPGKLRLLAEPLVPRRPAGQDDESLASFVTRRFGREVLERVAEPVLASLYTADADHLSLRVTMPRFLDLEAKDGSVTRGLRRAMRARTARPFGHGTGGGAFVALRSGMGRIVEALASRLPAGAVRTGVRVEDVRRGDRSSFEVHTSSGVLAASAVVLACPAYEAARLLRALDRPAATALDHLSYASCATVHLVYSGEQVRAPLRSFGFFVPRTEGSAILACSYVSEKFRERAPQGVVVFRAFVGGALRPDQIDAQDDALVAGAHDTLARVLSIASPPLRTRVDRHVRAMPQYPPGSLERLSQAVAGVERHDGLFVTGGITGAIGIPDCVRVAEAVALRVAAYEAGRRGGSATGECVAYQANQKA